MSPEFDESDFNLICGTCGIVLNDEESRIKHENMCKPYGRSCTENFTEDPNFPSDPVFDVELINIVDSYSSRTLQRAVSPLPDIYDQSTEGSIYDPDSDATGDETIGKTPDIPNEVLSGALSTHSELNRPGGELDYLLDEDADIFSQELIHICTHCGQAFTDNVLHDEHEKACSKTSVTELPQQLDLDDINIKNTMNATSSTPHKKRKCHCEMGEKCFTRKVEHFEQKDHPHLQDLLEKIGNGDLIIPHDYIPKISKRTLLEQLEIVKSLNENIVVLNESTVPTDLEILEGINKKNCKSDICMYGEQCYRKNPHHFMYYRHPHLEKIIMEYGDKMPEMTNLKISKQTLKEQLEFVKKFHCSTDKKSEESVENERPSTSTNSMASDAVSKPSKVSLEHEKNMESERKFRIVVLNRAKYKVIDKMKLATPYNLFLTTISDSPVTHSEMNSLCFPELLDPAMGDLESSLQINFMVQFGWLLAQYQIMGHRGKPLTLMYGDIDMEIDGKFSNFLESAKIIPPSPFGTHHTKMMVFHYTDKSIRVVVSTANLVETDWDNRTQGLWVSPRCPPLEPGSDTMSGDSVTNFKRDLLRYLSNYKIPQIVPWTNRIAQCDMSCISVFFIASVPGNHVANKDLWGQTCLRRVLNEAHTIPEKNSYPVIVQSSSIGSLGPNPDSWLLGDMLTTLTSGKKDGLYQRPSLKFVYPSYNNIINSYEGILGGGCLPYSKKTQDKQPWVTSFMCQWISEKRHRTRAPPHIKTYCRVSPDNSKLSYFLLTSANLSKAAWGNISKTGSINILSYEAGVLFVPQLFFGTDYFPLKDEINELALPLFPLPYDLPLTPYELQDVPWVIDHIL
ncbi:probable tyrosyl-DNA phosphodiesterase [Cimex lectularius]|uniref:PBZ-type domain-containing protein n=1 Tax=Cimex lectularius TaxID=79782 RepID=A0A8I6RMH7_CIMLE|nr:probable tyrosyl-DNA phosphodiesterase [Cimex lectularius]